MKIAFHKYQGTGNDFVMVDNRKLHWQPAEQEVKRLCHRKFGIGADGLILIQDHPDHDFEMVYYNSDGSQSLCGNGSRCAIHFANFLGIVNDETTFLTTDGVHRGRLSGDQVSFQLFDVLEIKDLDPNYFVDNGSPHYIKFVENVDDFNVFEQGNEIRYDPQFAPGGTNVNFVESVGDGIKVRTYERGVEDETLSCGTGVTAAALAASQQGLSSPVAISTLGGELEVSFTKNGGGFTDIYLTGPVARVFEGSVEL